MTHPLARLFEYDHLPEHLQEVSMPYARLANTLLYGDNPDDPLVHAALMKLWEAKNLAVLLFARPK
jgi:hypothetical protein